MKTPVVVSLTIIALSIPLLAGPQELPQRLGGPNGPPRAAPANRPVPKLPDGTIDLSGVWSGGGPVDDIGRQGGLTPGELERLMTPWAKQVFASRTEAQDP